jgi:hypothetical protein
MRNQPTVPNQMANLHSKPKISKHLDVQISFFYVPYVTLVSEKEIEAQRIMMEAYQSGGTRTRVTRSGNTTSKRSTSSDKQKKSPKKKKTVASSDDDEEPEVVISDFKKR